MKKLILYVTFTVYVFWVLGLFVATAKAQVPSAVHVTMLDNDKQKLGSLLHWPSTPGAEWDAYFYETVGVYGACPATIGPNEKWTQINAAPIVNNPAGNVLPNFPTPQPQFNFNLPYEGAGGVWCYGVARVVGGVDGPITAAPERMLLGEYLYMRYCLQSPPYITCDAHSGGQSIFQKGTWKVNRNGVPMPVRGGDTAAGYQYASVFRVLSTDKVDGSLTLTDGKILPLSQVVGPNRNPDFRRGYVQFLTIIVDKATENIVQIDHFERFRVASGGN